MSAAIKPPEFSLKFLLPQYWPIWFGAGVLYLITWLPLPAIRWLGARVGKLMCVVAPKRAHIARRNLELCYPTMSAEVREQLLQENIRRTGMALFETAMGWWWPSWRVKRSFHVEGFEHVENAFAEGCGVFGMALHNVNLEFACRGLGYTWPAVGFYRKHNNPLVDYMQYRGRAQSNKYLIHKRNAKDLINALDEGELCLYLPDQDYGRAQSIFVPFGGVKQTATTTATLMFIRRTKCVPMLMTSQYTSDGYKVKIYPPMPELVEMDDRDALTLLNKRIVEIIQEQPESYLWMHKRFKTRPDEHEPSLY
ncbi:LpxL/LpxP family Kdo(2)-lipid IV(A) lauroyl/palmitoleoyl acyltransferase [Alteromonas sp. ASW11-130]|uniref:LpxL/LpxP family Kdo(2)-lipid IV(A) lauroyl/palmitoleoyl acyltransferase n=1 Tax=Alteromonas sp. ASW11-130 TaxID=3015775 RepID=UPI002241ABB2|nr:LpxL/LpxP family Kdo(2)-lipid IV(A) lauroyl/palmitoleoyl acyltransferase [Alteromonas sp. ASW11-130]MCW8091253.1 LpxL/LpxP family Kdo(2)-lipid IV(A) lauroyl/palmitoleoyl acyltransferase [Alteromonas sp. ASW11-130]